MFFVGAIMRSRSVLSATIAAGFLSVLPSLTTAQGDRPALTLAVDASEVSRRILHSRETITVRPGALTLLYPKWIPGEHGPTGPVIDLVNLKVTSGGNVLPWRRDLEEMYAIHVQIPTGVSSIDVSFDFILPPQAEGFSSGASSSTQLLVLSWNQVVLYPSQPKPDDIMVVASVTLPPGWKHASALSVKDQSAGTARFAPVSLTNLIDSPVMAGAHVRRIDLTPASKVPHFLNLLSDNEAALDMTAQEVAAHKSLVVEANALFGAHHYDHYDFLYTLSDQVAHFGLEHHQSSDDRVAERTLLDDDLRRNSADLLPHEMVHSWNGKYRRPAGLATGDYSTPMKDDMLWVYEGLTQYLGKVLAGRSGLWTPSEYRENLAMLAANLDNRPGRAWRPLQDTNDEAQLLYYGRSDWDSMRRGTDFYDEGDLIWLEADATIRRLSRGSKSLDDFVKRFHGGASTGPMVKPYTFEDVVATLTELVPNDWKGFFESRLKSLSPRAPMGGIEESGWKLTYSDAPSSMQRSFETANGVSDLRYSLGMLVQKGGSVSDVIPGTPAARAGLAGGMQIVAVNGRKYSGDIMQDALKLGKSSSGPLELLIANGEFYKTYTVDYHGGPRYPVLQRDPSRADVLTAIITPKVKKT
jgi:predicted metalloprotease with PDZ domain